MWIEAISGGGGGTQITPSDATPVALVNGETYEAGGNGYAIETSPNDNQITPTADGVAFTSGIKKMMASGYAYSQQPSIFDLLKDLPSSAKITASAAADIPVTSGKHYLLICTQISTNTSTASESITGATVEWETTVTSTGASNSRQAYTKVYLVTATSSSITVSIRSGNVNKAYIALQLD